jgi:Pregnancy-associated plasma protein-A
MFLFVTKTKDRLFSTSRVCFHLLLLYCITTLLHPQGVVVLAHRNCLTESRPLSELKHVQAQIEYAKQEGQQLKSAKSHSLTCRQCITIVTHIIVYQCSATTPPPITKATVDEQFKVLVNGFAQTPFTFFLASVDFIVDPILCQDFTNSPRAAKHRKGGFNTLNIFLGGPNGGSFAYFPYTGGLETVPEDGIFVDITTVPGGESTCCNLGKTVIHEVRTSARYQSASSHNVAILRQRMNRRDIGTFQGGTYVYQRHTCQLHMISLLVPRLGLEHTFGTSDNPCDPKDRNDFVDDTPSANATEFDCPVLKDTCPLLPGLDPVENYMDYSNDECYNSFSPGQVERMYYVWSLYRQTREMCNPGFTLLELELVVTDGGGAGLENTFELRSENGTIQYWAGGREELNLVPVTFVDNVVNRLDVCIKANESYAFVLFDALADGLGPGGYYELRFNGTAVRPRGPMPTARRSERTVFRGNGSADSAFGQFLAVLRQIIELLVTIFG